MSALGRPQLGRAAPRPPDRAARGLCPRGGARTVQTGGSQRGRRPARVRARVPVRASALSARTPPGGPASGRRVPPRGPRSHWGPRVHRPPSNGPSGGRRTGQASCGKPERHPRVPGARPRPAPPQLRAAPASPERRPGRGRAHHGPSPGPTQKPGLTRRRKLPASPSPARCGQELGPLRPASLTHPLDGPHREWQAREGSGTPAVPSPAGP